jgi:hypothetical protein
VDRLENLIINPLNESWKTVEVTSNLNRQVYLGVLLNLADGNLANKLAPGASLCHQNKSAEAASRALSPISPILHITPG